VDDLPGEQGLGLREVRLQGQEGRAEDVAQVLPVDASLSLKAASFFKERLGTNFAPRRQLS
jgi:hypothetical protein